MKKQKKKEFQVPAKTSVFYAAFKNTVMRLLFRKPKIINLAGELPKKGIILANHSAKSGIKASGGTKRPRSSTHITRSASPSKMMPTSNPCSCTAAII